MTVSSSASGMETYSDATPAAPWPIVGECFGHWDEDGPRRRDWDETCPQCDGSHRHQWVAWHDAPRVSPHSTCVGGQSGPGLPARCVHCGGRKCDIPACVERRHHLGPHDLLTAPPGAE